MKKLYILMVSLSLLLSFGYAKKSFTISGISIGMSKKDVMNIENMECKEDKCKLEFDKLFISAIKPQFNHKNIVYKFFIESKYSWANSIENLAHIKAFNKMLPVKNKKYKVTIENASRYNLPFVNVEVTDKGLEKKYIKHLANKNLKEFNKYTKK